MHLRQQKNRNLLRLPTLVIVPIQKINGMNACMLQQTTKMLVLDLAQKSKLSFFF